MTRRATFDLELLLLLIISVTAVATGQTSSSVYDATLPEDGQRTKQVSTEELRKILVDKSAAVFDTRPFMEYAISHIPGAVNVSAKPGASIALYVSDVKEIGRLLKSK